MEFALQLFDRLLPFIVPKNVRLTNEIERLDKIIRNETDEKLREIHENNRKVLSFEIASGFKADVEDIGRLMEIFNPSRDIKWFHLKDAYRVWKVKNGVIQTNLSRKRKMLGGAFFTAGVSAFISGGWIAFFVAFWEKEVSLPSYFLAAAACLFFGFLSFACSLYFKEAERIHRILNEPKDES